MSSEYIFSRASDSRANKGGTASESRPFFKGGDSFILRTIN
ncbi:hypothetical protein BTEBP_80017 [Brochothrix thermosphacta]|nr:hypothetical protein BTEBP_80017 [Brochothrix thermosphacta]